MSLVSRRHGVLRYFEGANNVLFLNLNTGYANVGSLCENALSYRLMTCALSYMYTILQKKDRNHNSEAFYLIYEVTSR